MTKAKKGNKMDHLAGIDWSKFNPDSPDYKAFKHRAHEYAREELTISDLQENALSWFKKHDNTKHQLLSLLPSWKWSSIGPYFWMLNMGATLTQESMDWVTNQTALLLEQAKKIHTHNLSQPTKIEKTPKTPEQEGKELAQDLEDLILEGQLTGDNTEDQDLVYEVIQKNEPKPAILRAAVSFLNILVQELVSLSAEEIEEGFSSKKRYDSTLNQCRFLLQTTETYTQNNKRKRKATKKPRARVKRIDKVVKDVSFKEEDTELKLVSVQPSKIVGAMAALVYNAKTRKLGLYIATDDTGLNIKGTTIQNYNTETSIQKTLRKPADQIDGFRKAARKRAEVLLTDNYIKAKAQPLNGRLNEHTVIIQTWK